MEVMREGIGFDETRVDAKTMGLPLDALIVIIPVYNCLTRAGLKTVGDLVRLDIMQILQIKHLGKVVITEVRELLHSLEITGSAWDYLL
jgi:DNA-directed RNA polymerase alpha subunit